MLSVWKRLRSGLLRRVVQSSGAMHVHDQELLHAAWEVLNVARDNKALVLAKDGNIVNLNRLFSQLCGRSLPQLAGRNVLRELFDGPPRQSCDGANGHWQASLTTASGCSIPVEVTCQSLGIRLQGIDVYAIRDLRARHEAAHERERQARELRARDEEIRRQNLQFEMALTSVTLGLCVFDAEQRLVICNELYLRMYGLSRDRVRPGTTFHEIIELRVANGVHPGSPQAFIDERFAVVAAGVASTALHHLSDGRIVQVSHHPIPGGSWVTTHEDVTERQRMEEALEQSNRRLEHRNKLLIQREDELREQNVKFDAALENMLQGVAMFDADQRLIVCNKRYAQMYGLTPEQVKVGTTVREIFDHRLANGHYHVTDAETFVDGWAGDFGQTSSRIQQLADGRIISVLRRQAANGSRIVTHEDITERQKLNARLEQQHELLKAQDEALKTKHIQLDAALNNMVQGLAMFDGQHCVVIANDQYAEMYGLTREQVKPGTSLRQIVEYRIANGHLRGKAVDDIVNAILNRLQGEKAAHHTIAMEDGRYILVSAQSMPGGWAVTTHHDITEQRRSEAKIAHMALHDALTDLPNRTLLNERLQDALSRVKRSGIVAAHILDLDHFKKVNDTLGHAVGDKLLKVVTERLRALVRDSDTIARMGGDEFAIAQVGIADPTDATNLARRVIEAVSEPYEIDGHQVIIGASIGIAIGPTDGQDPDQLMRNADLALYRAKEDGRGACCFFEPEMDAQMQARRTMEYDLRKAIVAGEFELFYQPVVNLEHNAVSGVEALIRWFHPARGMISPGMFIPLAEEIGLIVPLGEWAIRRACATVASWPGDLKVAVNLSAAQFRNPGLVQVVVSALATSGLEARRLELEITESILMQDNEATLNTLNQLRELGVRIVMDDFGTGYSSLSYLQSFPFDKIKIDRSFVKDITQSSGALNIVRAVTALANGLGMQTTAEGVETSGQLESVRSEGCTEMQGFLFSKPRPAHEIAQLIRSTHKEPKAEDAA